MPPPPIKTYPAAPSIATHTHPHLSIDLDTSKRSQQLASSPPTMASRSSCILLAAAALAALVAVGSCASALSFKTGPGCSATKLVLIPSVAISEVEVKEKGADDFSELKEGPTGTWTLEGKAALKGPFSIRFAAKSGGYRVVDDAIPASFKSGSVYKTTLQV
ncbi:hypothetical protein PVAP13_6NG015200 [Panicum virgatum]|uniref:Expansin-like CBD domain-containing protein n=2 Tax=Panicum virgatum TaxID=38727 RepID=A0A8T0QTI7_PANVG|nr:hypothetical protein PVAP13_6NG015200 [Panicum virgatum]